MLIRKITETIEEYNEKGVLIKKTTIITDESDNNNFTLSPDQYNHDLSTAKYNVSPFYQVTCKN